ncbi:MAG: hypothetical protein KTR16_09105 [Acidiferrobacterales bacterium]|nr:hypothetical protein [Acidiferrobacterales bacterium]
MNKQLHTAFKQLPIVDISLLFSENKDDRRQAAISLDRAARDAGFLYLKGHGVSVALIDNLHQVVKEYFAQSMDVKMKNYIGFSQNHTGYVPQGEEQFYSEIQAPTDDKTPDLKEGYDIGPDNPSLMRLFASQAETQWPESDSFKRAVSQYYQAMLELSQTLFRGFALALDLPENAFDEKLTSPPSQLRLLHYFDNPDAKESDSGIGAHTDYEFFTILLPTAPGLQVLNGIGEWIDVPVVDGCFVLNIGDMMELVTNGEYVATSHRVQQVKEERYSFPFFSSLDYETLVEPISKFVTEGETSTYVPLICGDHLLEQTIKTFNYLQKRLDTGEIYLPEKSKGHASFGLHRGHTP